MGSPASVGSSPTDHHCLKLVTNHFCVNSICKIWYFQEVLFADDLICAEDFIEFTVVKRWLISMSYT